MDEQFKTLLSQVAEAIDRIESDQRSGRSASSEQLDRLASLASTLILTLKRSDANNSKALRHAVDAIMAQHSGMVTMQADVTRLLGLISKPEVLAALISAEDLDVARQIKRKTTLALTGKDRASKRGEITLVGITINGTRKAWRLSKKQYIAVLVALGTALGGGVYHLALRLLHR